MLELRPTCERCNKVLPTDLTEARICSCECPFCAHCVDTMLANVCPNCGSGFAARPIRPSRNLKGGNCPGKNPASTRITHRPVDAGVHAQFSASISAIPPEER